jgi:AcrR family transcriptional regulator
MKAVPAEAGRTPRLVPRLPHGEGRRALLEAVVRVVAHKGFDGLTYRAVAAEAGVTHGLVHYHFRTRQAMVAEALRWAAGEAIATSLSRVFPDEGRLDNFASALPELVKSHGDAQAFQHEVKRAACRVPELRLEVEALYDEYFAAVRRMLEQGGIEASDSRVRLFFAALHGLVEQQLFFQDPARTEESLQELREILRLLRKQSSARRETR